MVAVRQPDRAYPVDRSAGERASCATSILEDKTTYPDEATMRSLYTITAHDQKTQRLLNRLWTRIKTGR